MNVVVVYFGNDNNINKLADDIARYARSHAITPDEFDFNNHVDLLVVGMTSSLLSKKLKKDIELFFSKVNRAYVDNVALFSLYKFNNKILKYTNDQCIKNDLPLLRDQYSVKLSRGLKCELSDDILQGGRVFVNDMITIVQNYY